MSVDHIYLWTVCLQPWPKNCPLCPGPLLCGICAHWASQVPSGKRVSSNSFPTGLRGLVNWAIHWEGLWNIQSPFLAFGVFESMAWNAFFSLFLFPLSLPVLILDGWVSAWTSLFPGSFRLWEWSMKAHLDLWYHPFLGLINWWDDICSLWIWLMWIPEIQVSSGNTH